MSSTDSSQQQSSASDRAQKHEQPQSVGGSSGAPSQSTPSSSLNICEMNADKEHAALDAWAEEHGKSMKQKEQIFEYREEEEAGLNGAAAAAKQRGQGGVFVGGRKVDDKVLQSGGASTSKKEGADAASSK